MRRSLVMLSVVASLGMSVRAGGAEDACGYVTKGGYPMARSAEDLETFRQSMATNNAALWLALRQQGKGWISKAGLEACVVQAEGQDKVRIRIQGRSSPVWTLRDALERKGSR